MNTPIEAKNNSEVVPLIKVDTTTAKLEKNLVTSNKPLNRAKTHTLTAEVILRCYLPLILSIAIPIIVCPLIGVWSWGAFVPTIATWGFAILAESYNIVSGIIQKNKKKRAEENKKLALQARQIEMKPIDKKDPALVKDWSESQNEKKEKPRKILNTFI